MTYTVNFFPSRINIRSSEPQLRGFFFFVIYHKFIGPGHSRLPVVHRLSRRADLRSFRTAFGPPELAAPAPMPPGPARGRLRSASELVVRGRAVLLTHNMDAKVAEIPATAARIGQPHQAGRLARFRNICPLRPSMFRRQIFPSGSLPSEQSPGSAVSASLF